MSSDPRVKTYSDLNFQIAANSCHLLEQLNVLTHNYYSSAMYNMTSFTSAVIIVSEPQKIATLGFFC